MQHKELKSKVGKSATKIWDAYQEVLAELNDSPSDVKSTVAVAKDAKVKKAVTVTQGISIEGIEGTVTSLLESISSAKSAYDEIQIAIDAKKAELKEVHDLEVEANALVALHTTKEKMILNYDEIAVAKRQLVEDETKHRKDQAIEYADALIKKAKENANASEVTVAREEAEWDYNFDRLKTKKLDDVQDECNSRLKAVALKQEAIDNREEQLEDLESKILSLQSLIETMNIEKDELIQVAVDAAKVKAAKSAAIARSFEEKSHNAEMSILNANLDNMKERVADMETRLENADEMVSAANDKLAAMASSALRAGADAATVAKVSEIAAGSNKK